MLLLVIGVASVCCILAAALVGLYVYTRGVVRVCTSTSSLQGKTILITGGSSGVGFEAAKDFAARGARLLLPCRNQAKARAAIDCIIMDTGNEDIKLYKLDLSSLQSVEDFAEELLSSKDIQIDVLCLNAGCSPSSKRRESVDGFEYTFAANHLGHFHLTNLLRPLLAPSARIVITSSLLYRYARLSISNAQVHKGYHRLLAYGRTKLMNIHHMHELSERLSPHGITVNALHPGTVRTPIFEGNDLADWFLSRVLVPIVGIKPWEGAQTIIHLATCDKVQGITGKFFCDCEPCELHEVGTDREASHKLWVYCEKIIADWKEKRQSTIKNEDLSCQT